MFNKIQNEIDAYNASGCGGRACLQVFQRTIQDSKSESSDDSDTAQQKSGNSSIE